MVAKETAALKDLVNLLEQKEAFRAQKAVEIAKEAEAAEAAEAKAAGAVKTELLQKPVGKYASIVSAGGGGSGSVGGGVDAPVGVDGVFRPAGRFPRLIHDALCMMLKADLVQLQKDNVARAMVAVNVNCDPASFQIKAGCCRQLTAKHGINGYPIGICSDSSCSRAHGALALGERKHEVYKDYIRSLLSGNYDAARDFCQELNWRVMKL